MQRVSYRWIATLVLLLALLLLVPSSVFGERIESESSGEIPVLTWTNSDDLVKAMSKASFYNAVTSSEFRGIAEQAAVFSQSIQNFPMHGDTFTLISTGYASEAPGEATTYANTWVGGSQIDNHSPHGYDVRDLAELDITVTVPNDAKTLAFKYKFGTEENPTFLGSVFQDYFRVLAHIPGAYVNNYIPLLPDGSRFVSVDNANEYSNSPGGSSGSPLPPFPEPNDTVYNAVTALMPVYFDVSSYQGMEMTLTIEISDASDGILDSAIFLDSFEFSTEVLTPPTPKLVQTLVVRANSPVSICLVDSAGRITGVDGGETKSEIPGASYDPDTKEITIIGAYDDYTIKVYGDDTGTYSLYTKFYDEEKGQWFSFNLEDVPITAGETHEYNDLAWELLAISRLFGGNRFVTAVEISKSGWDSADTVVLARGDDYADALAGVPLAYQLDAPILLTPTGSLHEATEAEIARLGANKVILLGGTAAISNAVKGELEAKGLTVERIAGINRYDTAAKVAESLAELVTFDTAFIAVGTNFADALAASSYAAMRGEPILLTGTNTLPGATIAAIADLGIDYTYVCGGTAAVSDSVFNNLPNPERLWGLNRYATAEALANKFLPDGAKHVGIATGRNFPDAVAGGVWAAKHNTGILLVDGTKSEPGSEVQDFLGGKGITSVTIFGGTVVVSTPMASWLEANLGD